MNNDVIITTTCIASTVYSKIGKQKDPLLLGQHNLANMNRMWREQKNPILQYFPFVNKNKQKSLISLQLILIICPYMGKWMLWVQYLSNKEYSVKMVNDLRLIYATFSSTNQRKTAWLPDISEEIPTGKRKTRYWVTCYSKSRSNCLLFQIKFFYCLNNNLIVKEVCCLMN